MLRVVDGARQGPPEAEEQVLLQRGLLRTGEGHIRAAVLLLRQLATLGVQPQGRDLLRRKQR